MSLKMLVEKSLQDMYNNRQSPILQEIISERNTAEEIDVMLDQAVHEIWMEMGDFHYFRSEWPSTVKSFRNMLAISRPDLAFKWSSMGYI